MRLSISENRKERTSTSVHLFFRSKHLPFGTGKMPFVLFILMGLFLHVPVFAQVKQTNPNIQNKAKVKPPTNVNLDKIGKVRPKSASYGINLTSPKNLERDLPVNLTLHWQKYNGLQGSPVKYDVYLGTNPGQLPKASTGQTGTSYNATGLLSNANYYWRVVAVTSEGKNASSQTWNFHVHNNSPNTVNLIGPANMETNVPLNCTLSWGEVTDPDGNQIFYSVYLNTEWVWVNDKNTNARIANLQSATSTQHNLTAGEKYYWRVLAFDNRGGVSESEVRSFIADPVGWGTPVTTGSFTDSRDNKTYQTVTIGNQMWMSENLAYLPEVNRFHQGFTQTDLPDYFVYGYSGDNVQEAKATENFQTYGALYNIAAAAHACPSGWHLPTDGEWKQLELYLGMPQQDIDKEQGNRGVIVAGTLREPGTAHWIGSNPQVNNASGFNALPSGFTHQGSSYQMGVTANWWTYSRVSPTQVYNRALYYNANFDIMSISRYKADENKGLSVRCVKD